LSKHLLFIVHTPEFFLSHRLPLALAARDAGYKVTIATGPGNADDIYGLHQFEWFEIPISRRGKVLLEELRTIYSFYRLLKKLKPNLVHLVAIKPVLYGGIVTKLLGVPTVFAISGLGTVFSDRRNGQLTKKIVERLYRFVFNRNNLKVVFQNESDKAELKSITQLKDEYSIIVKGSGVALNQFQFFSEPETEQVTILMASRLILEKGVREYIEAAAIARKSGLQADFLLAGAIDEGNPNYPSQPSLFAWCKRAGVKYIGHKIDMASLFRQSHIFVLPSYYGEGLPKVLVEAAAAGRPIITTDHPGCRDAIIENETGLLVPTHDVKALADAMIYLAQSEDIRKMMGTAARLYARKRFDIRLVVAQHLDIYNSLIDKPE